MRTLSLALSAVIVATAAASGQSTTESLPSGNETAGGHPKLVAGHADNIKITLPGDLALAELFLKQQEKCSE